MATGAHIRIDQATNPTPTGTYGVGRDDLRLGAGQLVADSSGGQGSFLWTLVDRPTGSSASISNHTTAAASITYDVDGPYGFSLAVDDGLGANLQTMRVTVTRDAAGIIVGHEELILPSFAEDEDTKNAQNDGRGHAKLFETREKHSVMQLATIAALRLRKGSSRITRAFVKAYSTAGDGGGGDFIWNSTNNNTTRPDDGGTIIAPTGLATGCWERLHTAGHVHLEWFGGKGDADGAGAGTNNLTALQAAHTALGANGGVIELGYGRFRITGTFTISNRVTLRGRGNTNIDSTVGATEIIKAATVTTDAITMTARCASIENLVVRGETGNLGNGITLSGTTGNQVLDRVSVFGAGDDGIRVGQDVGGNSDAYKLLDIVSADNGRDGLHLASNIGSPPDCNAGNIRGAMLRENGRHGLYLGNAWFNTFTGILSEANVDTGIYVDDGAAWCDFLGGDIETNATDFFVHASARCIGWGISFLNEFIGITEAEPTVGARKSFVCDYAAPTDITNFLGAAKDHEITIRMGANATIKHDPSKISLLGSTDFGGQDTSSFIHFRKFGTVWLEQWRRSNASNYFPNLKSESIIGTLDAQSTTQSPSIQVVNNTAAAAGAPQYSPGIQFVTHGWATGAGASREVDAMFCLRALQDTTTYAALDYLVQVNAGGYKAMWTFEGQPGDHVSLIAGSTANAPIAEIIANGSGQQLALIAVNGLITLDTPDMRFRTASHVNAVEWQIATAGCRLDFSNGVLSAAMGFKDNTTNGATGAPLSIVGQNMTGTGLTIGGAVNIYTGQANTVGECNIYIGDTNLGLKVAPPADTETALLIRRNHGGVYTVQRVSEGAADSGGAGYRCLRVVN